MEVAPFPSIRSRLFTRHGNIVLGDSWSWSKYLRMNSPKTLYDFRNRAELPRDSLGNFGSILRTLLDSSKIQVVLDLLLLIRRSNSSRRAPSLLASEVVSACNLETRLQQLLPAFLTPKSESYRVYIFEPFASQVIVPRAQMSLFRRLFFRFSQTANFNQKRQLSSSPLMSSSATAAALYAATVSSSTITGATPEEAKEKRHHVKDGKGFVNPWDSWKEMPGPAIAREMIWYATRSYRES